ncbi:MAG: NAD(P)-dependent oxidoreductase, partial [Megasphaera sp.]
NWDRKTFTGIQLQNKTLGIIGVGRIGSRIAKRMQAMEMKTIGYDPYIPEERFKQLGVEPVDLDTLLERSDYITMHTPLTKETTGLIGKDEIAKMKDGVRVINVSRGAVLDINALADALKSGHVAGAAIDVFPTEPLTTDINPFVGMDNVVITPHLGASTVEAQIGVSVDVAEGVMEALKGEPVATAVNMAPVPPHVYNVIHPYFDLMERMGNLGVYLADAPMKEIEVEYTGELADTETRLLTTAVLKGALNPILQESVNYVNASEVAKSRHIAVKEINSQSNNYFVNSVTVRVRTNKGEHAIVGVLFNGTEAKIVQIDEYRVDFKPEGYLLLVPHVDQPNMIGQISTILGQAHI